MLKKGAKIVSLSGISMVEFDDKTDIGKIAMHMSATINLTDGKSNITETVEDTSLYDKHYDQVENDFAAFRKFVKEERDRLLGKEGD